MSGSLIAMALFVPLRQRLTTSDDRVEAVYVFGVGWGLVTASWLSGLSAWVIGYGSTGVKPSS